LNLREADAKRVLGNSAKFECRARRGDDAVYPKCGKGGRTGSKFSRTLRHLVCFKNGELVKREGTSGLGKSRLA